MPMTKDTNREIMAHRLVVLGSSVWAMDPDTWPVILARASMNAGEGETRPYPQTQTVAESPGLGPEAKAPKLPAVKGMVGVLPVRGVIVQHEADAWFGDVSTDWMSRGLDELQANPQVSAILMDIASPGGVVFGVEELADKIRGYRENGGKPVYALANAFAASAAYWLASQADKLFVTPSGQVGSVGVWSAHVDVSKMEENMGIKTTLVSAGKYKVEGHPFAPLDEEARARMQEEVDQYYQRFLSGVALGRQVKPAVVKSDYGEGRMLLAAEAMKAGMVDGIHTKEEVLSALLRNKQDGARARMADAEIGLVEAGESLSFDTAE